MYIWTLVFGWLVLWSRWPIKRLTRILGLKHFHLKLWPLCMIYWRHLKKMYYRTNHSIFRRPPSMADILRLQMQNLERQWVIIIISLSESLFIAVMLRSLFPDFRTPMKFTNSAIFIGDKPNLTSPVESAPLKCAMFWVLTSWSKATAIHCYSYFVLFWLFLWFYLYKPNNTFLLTEFLCIH